MIALRPELEPLPERMKDLAIDRGYPVPWFVEWVRGADGRIFPEFRAMSARRWTAAVKKNLCWVCGKRLGKHLAFVIGPMCGVTRTTSEPPSHLECATWSARNCPFLSRPDMVRRDLAKDYSDAIQPAGEHIDRNPGATLVWVTNEYSVFDDGRGGYLIHVGEPTSITCYSKGRIATPEEVEASLLSGLPFLLEKAQSDTETQDIHNLVGQFRQLVNLPASANMPATQPAEL